MPSLILCVDNKSMKGTDISLDSAFAISQTFHIVNDAINKRLVEIIPLKRMYVKKVAHNPLELAENVRGEMSKTGTIGVSPGTSHCTIYVINEEFSKAVFVDFNIFFLQSLLFGENCSLFSESEKMVDYLLKRKRLTLDERQFIYDFLMDTGREKWRYIEGYWGYYRVSTEGFVYSCRRKNLLTPSERTVNPLEGKKAYQVMLSVNGEAKGASVHKLVAQTFIPNPSGAVTVIPKDGDYRHCDVRNLMWKSRAATSKIAAKIELIEAA